MYDPPEVAKFLSGADPWVIAHAVLNDTVLVTLVQLITNPNSKKIKIPNQWPKISKLNGSTRTK